MKTIVLILAALMVLKVIIKIIKKSWKLAVVVLAVALVFGGTIKETFFKNEDVIEWASSFGLTPEEAVEEIKTNSKILAPLAVEELKNVANEKISEATDTVASRFFRGM